MRAQKHPSDLTDDQWNVLQPVLPKRRKHAAGRPRSVRQCDVVDAILYILRTECQWRMLPHDFPPWGIILTAKERCLSRLRNHCFTTINKLDDKDRLVLRLRWREMLRDEEKNEEFADLSKMHLVVFWVRPTKTRFIRGRRGLNQYPLQRIYEPVIPSFFPDT